MIDPTTSGAEDFARLLTAAACSAGCLLARPASACTCRCSGAHHGAVLKALTGQRLAPTPVPLHQAATQPTTQKGTREDG